VAEKRRILVLGSNAFAGADLVDLLLQDQDNQVVGVSRSPEKSELFLPYRRRTGADFRFYQMDLNRDMDQVLELCRQFRPSHIVNMTALCEVAPSWEHPQHWFQTNLCALAELARGLRDAPYLERFLQISSPEVYGSCARPVKEDAPFNPSTPYAVSKAAADMFLQTMHRQYGFPVIIIRSTNYYGAHQQLWKIIPRSVIYIKSGRTIELHGGGRAVKSFIHVRDVSRGEVLALFQGRVGQIYHLSPERGYQVRQVVERICQLMGVEFEQATRTVDERPGQDAAYLVDSEKARRELGWSPRVELDQGLAEVIQWVEANWPGILEQPLEYRHRA